MAISSTQYDITMLLIQAQMADHSYSNTIHKFQSQQSVGSRYSFKKKITWYGDKIQVPNNSSLKSVILHEYHATPVGGHVGSLRTYARIPHQFFW